MMIYPDDRILVAVMNNLEDWQRVQREGWYRLPVKHAPEDAPNFDWLAFYFTSAFGSDKWAIHYYAHVKGHELVTRRDLFPAEAAHQRAGNWYYKLQLEPLQHKLPPIISYHWRRITFIVTSGDRFEAAEEINDLFENKSPVGQLYVTLKEAGFQPERNWPLREQGVSYVVDLAVPLGGDQWLPIALTSHESTPIPPGALCFTAESDLAECVRRVRQATQPKI